jgi:hypothetical protein
MKISGKPTLLNVAAEKIFGKMSNCNHFGQFLPENINNWQSSEKECSFSLAQLNNMRMQLKITEKIPFSKIVFQIDNEQHIPVLLEIILEEKEQKTLVQIYINADVPVFLTPLLKAPLQNFVDKLSEKLQTFAI